MPSRFTHSIAWVRLSFPSKTGHFLYPHSSIRGHLGCFHTLAVVNTAAVRALFCKFCIRTTAYLSYKEEITWHARYVVCLIFLKTVDLLQNGDPSTAKGSVRSISSSSQTWGSCVQPTPGPCAAHPSHPLTQLLLESWGPQMTQFLPLYLDFPPYVTLIFFFFSLLQKGEVSWNFQW
jgi:hypothetical protein